MQETPGMLGFSSPALHVEDNFSGNEELSVFEFYERSATACRALLLDHDPMALRYRQWLQRELAAALSQLSAGHWAGLVLQPLAQILAVYAWSSTNSSRCAGRRRIGRLSASTAWPVFIGLSLVTAFVAEVINRSPGSISGLPYLVTKVRFALLLLPAVGGRGACCSSLSSWRQRWCLCAAGGESHGKGPAVAAGLLLPLLLYGQALAWLLCAAGCICG